MALSFLCGDRLAPLADRPVPDHANAGLRPERHQHEGAGAGFDPVGEQVVVGLVERHRQQHGHAALGRDGGLRMFIQLGKQALQIRYPGTRSSEANRLDSLGRN